MKEKLEGANDKNMVCINVSKGRSKWRVQKINEDHGTSQTPNGDEKLPETAHIISSILFASYSLPCTSLTMLGK